MDVTTLGTLLAHPDDYADDTERYVSLPVDEEWLDETPAKILGEDELDQGLQGDDFQPWSAAASLDVYAEVIRNLTRQKEEPTPEERLDAFIYFWETHRFLDLSGDR